MSFRVIPALLLLGLISIQLNRIDAFIPSHPLARTNLQAVGNNGHNSRSRRHRHLSMVVPRDDAHTYTGTGTHEPTGTSTRDVNEIVPGNVVAERYIYRFSPTKSTIQTPYNIEERHYFSIAQDGSRQPLGDKCFIFRKGDEHQHNSDAQYHARVGPALYTVGGIKDDCNTEGLSETICDSNLVMALYCMGNPEIIGGKGLELGSGAGVGGILSLIGAGIASENAEEPDGVPGDSDRPFRAPTPSSLSEFVFADSNRQLLHKCIDNIGAASIDVEKVKLTLDRETNIQEEMKDQFNFIIACDCEHNTFPLAKTIANSLKSSEYDEFLHIGPQHHGDSGISELQHELEAGYSMKTISREIVLEKFHVKPLVLDSLEHAEAQMKDETDGKTDSCVEYQRTDIGKFSAVVGCHNEYYDGSNGEMYFPAERLEEQVAEEASAVETQEDIAKKLNLDEGEEKRINTTYMKWLSVYRKQYDESRFWTFASNFLEMEIYCRENGQTMHFNRWLDCTEEECIAINSGQPIANVEATEAARFDAEAKARLGQIAVDADKRHKARVARRLRMEAEEREIAARVHVKYVDWCEVYGKELDEARFRTFLSNFLAMEAHADETGQTMLLNQWYDCTQEEHMLAVEAEEQEKADHEARIAAHAVEMAKAEEEKKLALKAQRKIAEKAMKHKKKAVDLARIAQEHWKKAEKEAKLAAETEAKVRNEDKYILAAGNNVLARSSDEVALVQTTEARLRQEAATMEQRFILASRYKMQTAETERMGRIHSIYLEWCDVYGKRRTESQFFNFASNFMVMEAHADESGEPFELNQWYDYSKDDFIAVSNGMELPSAIVAQEKEEEEETVVPLENVEVLEAQAAIRQAWYKCTEEEHDALVSGRAEVKIEMVEDDIKEALNVNYIEAQTAKAPARMNAHSGSVNVQPQSADARRAQVNSFR